MATDGDDASNYIRKVLRNSVPKPPHDSQLYAKFCEKTVSHLDIFATKALEIFKSTYPTDFEYKGENVNDLYHGKGVAKFANGDKYEGDFVEGKRTGTGKGIFIWG